jgi:hypothetical protein
MRHFVMIVSAVVLAAAPLGAQGRGGERRDRPDEIPVAYRPPAGMCRIWIDGVPPAQQSAPTDCPTAVRNRPPDARVIFGDDYVKEKSRKDSGGRLPVLPMAPRREPPRPAGADERVELGRDDRGRDDRGRDDRRRADRVDADDDDELDDDVYFADRRRGAARRADRAADDRSDRGPSGGVPVILPGDDPRYFNNGRTPPPGRNSTVCLDRDGDGWCDDARYGPPACLDVDRDGRCDDLPVASLAYPQTLPVMRSAADVVGGVGSAEVARWLGTNEVTPRLTDMNRDGSPERVMWLDANGQLLQVWSDRNRDGRADRVEIYPRADSGVKLIGR